MRNSIHSAEKQIINDWKQLAQSLGDDSELVEDGLLYRGDIFYENECWHRLPGNEEELWNNAPRKLLILTKDLNDDEAWDIREETGRYNMAVYSYEKAISFYKNLRMWSYGLFNTTADHSPTFEEARDMNVSGPFYESAPIARINCKKQVGGGTISDAVLLSYLEKYAELLKRQVMLYDADIILCCGKVILDFVRAQCLTDLSPVAGTEGWMYHSPSTNKVVIHSHHPSNRIGYENPYRDMMSAFKKALAQI